MVKLNKQTNTMLVIAVIVLAGAIAFMLDTKILAQPSNANQTQINTPDLSALNVSNLASFADFQAKFTGGLKTAQGNGVEPTPADQPVNFNELTAAVYKPTPLPDLPQVITQVSPKTGRKVVSILNTEYIFYCNLIGGVDVFTGDKGEATTFLSLPEDLRASLVAACLR